MVQTLAHHLSMGMPSMSSRGWLWRVNGRLPRYGVALVAVTLAWLAREQLLPEATERSPFVAFGLAILLTALVSGFGPGLLATASSALIAVLFYLPPYVALAVHAPVDVALLMLFVAEGVVATVVGAVVRETLQPGPPMTRASADRYSWFVERAEALRGHLVPGGGPLLDPLTPRESEVARLLALGLSNDEIARAMFISTNTAKTHLKRIYGKLDVQTRTEAVARCIELGLLEIPPEGDAKEYLEARRQRARVDERIDGNHPVG
jgi:DNA-binding CsgD family transcriptional regulator